MPAWYARAHACVRAATDGIFESASECLQQPSHYYFPELVPSTPQLAF